MDCVTCILVGVCVMCGPGFGRSSGGAQSPGRPMTEAELNQVLEAMLQRFQATKKPPVVNSPATYTRRQNFVPDLRFSDIGIGKRNIDNLSPYGSNLQNSRSGQYRNRLPLWTSLSLMGVDLGNLKQKRTELSLMKPGFGLENFGVKENSLQHEQQIANQLGEDSVPTKFDGLTVESLMKRFRRSRLEQLLLGEIQEQYELADELEKAETDGEDGNVIESVSLL